jgi:hypothetical protein
MSIIEYLFPNNKDLTAIDAVNLGFAVIKTGPEGEIVCVDRDSIDVCDDDEFVMIDVDVESRIKCTTSIMNDVCFDDEFCIIKKREYVDYDLIGELMIPIMTALKPDITHNESVWE